MKIVNKRTHTPTPHDVYVGRPSPLGNPFPVPPYRRSLAIGHYRNWLWQKIDAGDPTVLAALAALSEESVLVCWCDPLPCHATVIAEVWAMLQRRGTL